MARVATITRPWRRSADDIEGRFLSCLGYCLDGHPSGAGIEARILLSDRLHAGPRCPTTRLTSSAWAGWRPKSPARDRPPALVLPGAGQALGILKEHLRLWKSPLCVA